MKQLPKEIHVESLGLKHGAEIIATFKKLGVDTSTYDGSNWMGQYRFYGINHDGVFRNREKNFAGNIVTLEELKSYLEDEIPELPDGVLMYVSDQPIVDLNNKMNVRKRLVFGKRGDRFLAWSDTYNKENISGHTILWKYTLPIPGPIEDKAVSMTVAEIEKALGITKLNVVK